jgi:hypothetical protein
MFIEMPDIEKQGTLAAQISSYVEKCDWGSKYNSIAVPPAIRPELFEHISNGNRESLTIGLFIVGCLDGGDLGDFKRSAVKYFEMKPVDFLENITTNKISMSLYTAILAMPLIEDVDNIESRVITINRRIELLKDIDLEQHAELKATGLEVLEDEKTSLQNIRMKL